PWCQLGTEFCNPPGTKQILLERDEGHVEVRLTDIRAALILRHDECAKCIDILKSRGTGDLCRLSVLCHRHPSGRGLHGTTLRRLTVPADPDGRPTYLRRRRIRDVVTHAEFRTHMIDTRPRCPHRGDSLVQ